MADTNDHNGVKMSWAVTIQLVILLTAIGIAWGNLSAKQGMMETQQNGLMTANAAILQKLEAVQEQVSDVKAEIRYSRVESRNHK